MVSLAIHRETLQVRRKNERVNSNERTDLLGYTGDGLGFTHVYFQVMPQGTVLRVIPLDGICHGIRMNAVGDTIRQKNVSGVVMYCTYLERLHRRIFFGHLVLDTIPAEGIAHFAICKYAKRQQKA